MSFAYNLLAQMEDRFEFHASQRWFKDNWIIAVYASALYAITIFVLKQWMKHKTKGYEVRRWLFLWSTGLAVFSIIGSSINGTQLWSVINTDGFMSTLCISREDKQNGVIPALAMKRYGLWSWCFVLSKVIELGDTYFIILKKQPLIFLHWYHHITVMLYTWYAYREFTAVNQWFLCINFCVHSIMYTYYSIRASGIYKPPIWVNMFITSLQILQMIVGLSLNLYVYLNIGDPNWDCDSNTGGGLLVCYVSFAMYFSYFLLFIHFFISTYIISKSNKKLDYKSPKESSSVLNGHMKMQ